jgi:hypothetical protein
VCLSKVVGGFWNVFVETNQRTNDRCSFPWNAVDHRLNASLNQTRKLHLIKRLKSEMQNREQLFNLRIFASNKHGKLFFEIFFEIYFLQTVIFCTFPKLGILRPFFILIHWIGKCNRTMKN